MISEEYIVHFRDVNIFVLKHIFIAVLVKGTSPAHRDPAMILIEEYIFQFRDVNMKVL
jgi:hypothetical protein